MGQREKACKSWNHVTSRTPSIAVGVNIYLLLLPFVGVCWRRGEKKRQKWNALSVVESTLPVMCLSFALPLRAIFYLFALVKKLCKLIIWKRLSRRQQASGDYVVLWVIAYSVRKFAAKIKTIQSLATCKDRKHAKNVEEDILKSNFVELFCSSLKAFHHDDAHVFVFMLAKQLRESWEGLKVQQNALLK